MHTVQLVCFFVPYKQGLSKGYMSLPLLSVWKGHWYVSACVLFLNPVKYTTIMYLVVPIHLFRLIIVFLVSLSNKKKINELCALYFSPFTSYQNQFYDSFIYKEPTVIPLLFYIWSENDVCQSFFSIFFCRLFLVMMMGEPCSSALPYLLTFPKYVSFSSLPCL